MTIKENKNDVVARIKERFLLHHGVFKNDGKLHLNSDYERFGLAFDIDDFINQCLETSEPAFTITRDEAGHICELKENQLSKYLFLLGITKFYLSDFSLTPYQNLFFESLEKLQVVSTVSTEPRFELYDNYIVADLFNDLINEIRSSENLKKYKSEYCSRRFQINENERNSIRLINDLFDIFGVLCIVRVDFGYKRNVLGEVDQERVKKDICNLLNKLRRLPPLRDKVGYLIKIENSRNNGPHIHGLFIFDGNLQQDNESLAATLEEYWVDNITNGEGEVKNYKTLKGCHYHKFTGLINKDEKEKIEDLFDYGIRLLTKSDQYLNLIFGPDFKGFRLSRITPSLRGRKKQLASNPYVNQTVQLPETELSVALPKNSLGIRLGTDVNSGARVDWCPLDEDNAFFRIVGASGSGKTELLKWLLYQLNLKGLPVLLFDFHGDVIIPGFENILLSSGYGSFYGVNPMELDFNNLYHIGFDDQIEELFEMIKQAFDKISPRQSETLRMAIEEAFFRAGIFEQIPSTWNLPQPRFSDVISVLEDLADDPPLGTNSASYTSCIAAIRKLFRHKIFDRNNNLTIQYLTSRATRLDLSGPSYDVKYVVTETILKMLFRAVRSLGPVPIELKGSKEQIRIFVVIDEASILFMGQGHPNNQKSILNVLMREARKFGIAIIVASQMSSHFGVDVTANAAAALVLKTSDPKEAKINAESIGVAAKDILELNQVGLGYFKTKSSNKISLVKIEPGKFD